MKQYVVYRRVSTQEQAKSGLGLEAQERDIDIYLTGYSEEPWEVIGEFEDTGSGADNERPEFQKALALVRKTGAELLVSKLDRLSRRVSVIASLIEDRNIRFRVATMPHADPFQLHIYAALAEQEREFISKRTKAALQAAKARGVKLGGSRGGDAFKVAAAARKAKADQYAGRVGTMIIALRAAGKTYGEVVAELEQLGVPRPQGGSWSEMAVRRVLKRLDDQKAPLLGEEAA
jgi:DNA invertase Pin-like site-specific DNA recombinase